MYQISLIIFSIVTGPPHAEQKELKKIGRIGDTIRLICPVSGFPKPMVEWSKNGEIIDFMWDRHKKGGKSLKIKHVTEDDTGIFTCKGINGFGSEEVRIELIIVGKSFFCCINKKICVCKVLLYHALTKLLLPATLNIK